MAEPLPPTSAIRHGREACADSNEAAVPIAPGAAPFLQHLGASEWSMGEGRAWISLALTAAHMNSWHVAHGGVTMTLLDVAMSLAGRSLDAKALAGATVEMKTTFLAPAGKPGECLVAKGHAFHRSTTLYFCEGELWNGERLVAKAMGTYKTIRRIERRAAGSAQKENTEHG